jgi:hypothetical protein
MQQPLKAGGQCAVAGSMQIAGGKRFICQGEGRQDNFQWDKGTPTTFVAKIPIALPVPAATGPDAITFTNVMSHIQDIPKVAYQNVQDTIAKNPATVIPHTLMSDQRPPRLQKTLEEELLAKEFRLWSGFQQTSFLNVIAYNNLDTDWAQKQFKQIFALKNIQLRKTPMKRCIWCSRLVRLQANLDKLPDLWVIATLVTRVELMALPPAWRCSA